MAEFTLRNLSGQAVSVYYYRAGSELSISIEPSSVVSFEADTLSPSAEGLLRSGVIKSTVASQTQSDVSQSIQVYSLGFTGLWVPDFYYERGFVASWNGINWYSKKAHKGSTAPSLINQNWGYFGVSDIDSLVGINVGDASLYSVLAVGPKLGGGQEWQAVSLSGEMFDDGSIPIGKVEQLTDTLSGLMPLSGGELTGPISLATLPVEDEHLANKLYVDQKVPLGGGTMTGKLYYAEDILIDSDTQLATKGYVDAIIQDQLLASGGNMTGFLTLVPGNPVNPFHAAPKVYVDSKLSLEGGELTGMISYVGDLEVLEDGHLTNKAYVDQQALAGGTMTGLLTLSGAPSTNFHAATKLYVDTTALAGGLLTGLLSLPADIPLISDLNLTPKGYVDDLTDALLPKAGGIATGALHYAPGVFIGASTQLVTKGYVDTVLGVSGDVLLLAGGTMSGPILGDHGLLSLDGLAEMSGPLRPATLEDSPQTTAITAVADAGSGTVWLSLASASGWATSQKAVVTGAPDYNGTHQVLEVSASPARIRITAAFTVTRTGTATATQTGLYHSSDLNDLVYEGRQFVTQGRAISVSADYMVENGDGLILADASALTFSVTLGPPGEFSPYPVTIRKADRNAYSPVTIKVLGWGRSADLSLTKLGESVTLQASGGVWGIVGRYDPNDEEALIEWGSAMLHTSGQTEVDVVITPQARKTTSGTIADGGGGEIDITVVDAVGFSIGQTVSLEGSRHGYNGDYEVVSVGGSIISVVAAFTVVDTCYVTGSVPALRQVTSILAASALEKKPVTEELVNTISAVASGGTGLILLTLDSVAGWTIGHSVVVSGTSTYDDTYVIEAVNSGANTLTVAATFASTSTGLATMTVGASVEESVDQVGRSFSTGYTCCPIRSQPTGLLRARVAATADLTSEIKRTYLHALSGGDLNLYGETPIDVDGVGNLTAEIDAVDDATGGFIWLVLSNILGWAEGDSVSVTGTTSYNATYLVDEVDVGNTRIKVEAVYVASELGVAVNTDVISLVAPEASSISAGDYLTARGATKLGAEVVDFLVDAIVAVTPEVVFTTRDLVLAPAGSSSCVVTAQPSQALYLVRPWAWYRHEFLLAGANVQTWIDISGNGRDLEQATSGLQPAYSASGINEYRSVSLAATKNMALAVGKGTPITVFIVLKADTATPAADEIILDGSHGTNFMRFRRITGPDRYSLSSGGSTMSINATGGSAFSTGAHVYTLRVAGLGSFIRKDGSELVAGTLSESIDDLVLGDFAGLASFAGKVAELQVYNTLLTTPQIQYIEQALINRYV